MRNNLKKFEQFLNEENYDSFIINVKYDVGYCDIDSKNILTSALQKSYRGFDDKIFLDDYSLKNNIELKLIDSIYDDETYQVIFNKDLDEYNELDKEDDIFNFIKKTIESITYYSYRSVHSMDDLQKADIEIKSINKVK